MNHHDRIIPIIPYIQERLPRKTPGSLAHPHLRSLGHPTGQNGPRITYAPQISDHLRGKVHFDLRPLDPTTQEKDHSGTSRAAQAIQNGVPKRAVFGVPKRTRAHTCKASSHVLGSTPVNPSKACLTSPAPSDFKTPSQALETCPSGLSRPLFCLEGSTGMSMLHLRGHSSLPS